MIEIKPTGSASTRPIEGAIVPIDAAAAQRVVDRAVRRYFIARHAKVDGFVDTHFTLSGSLRLHRGAVGLDLLRAPANVALMLPAVGIKVAAFAARRLRSDRAAEWLDRRDVLLRTAVGREIEWLLHTELLELPFEVGPRVSDHDALVAEILCDPELIRAVVDPLRMIGQHAEDPDLRGRMTEILKTYAGSRAAAAELANAVVNLGAGAATLGQFTPTAASLGPALAGVLAQHLAVTSFPLGATLGGLWYGVFPAAPSALLVGATVGGLLAGASIVTAFAGVLTDPLQRGLRLHQRRLHRILDVLEADFHEVGAEAFVARELYAARLLDLVDILRMLHRGLA